MPYIESISNKGLMKVRFVQPIPSMNASLINQTHIRMFIEPTNKDDKNLNLNFTWNCTKMNATLMQFKLDFENPVDISPYLPFDTIFFVTSSNFSVPNVTISSNIKPQLMISNQTKSQE